MTKFNGGVRVTGSQSVIQKLRQAQREHRADVMKTLREIGDIALSETVDRTPIDESTLTNDVESAIEQDGDETAVIIRVPLNAPSSQYAIPMHENTYKLGPGSAKKQARVGKEVGTGYIIRGVNAGKPEYDNIVKDNLGV